MKTVYLVRHGESEGNVGLYFQGIDNSPLTERGKEQARFVATRCMNLPVDVMISSPALRTKETAEMISSAIDKPIEWSDLFVERDDPEAAHMEESWDKSLYDEHAPVSDGEHFVPLRSRARAALAYLEKREEQNILVVTHGFFMRAMLAYVIFGETLTGAELKKFIYATRTENSGITVITDDSNVSNSPWRIRVFNDHAHLG